MSSCSLTPMAGTLTECVPYDSKYYINNITNNIIYDSKDGHPNNKSRNQNIQNKNNPSNN